MEKRRKGRRWREVKRSGAAQRASSPAQGAQGCEDTCGPADRKRPP